MNENKIKKYDDFKHQSPSTFARGLQIKCAETQNLRKAKIHWVIVI